MSRNLPAFPLVRAEIDGRHDGLTKRELFAAMAMQSLIGLMEARDAKSGWSSRAASTAVACADALLAELAKDAP